MASSALPCIQYYTFYSNLSFFYIHHGNVNHKKNMTRFSVCRSGNSEFGVKNIKKWDLVGPHGEQRSGQVRFFRSEFFSSDLRLGFLAIKNDNKVPFFFFVFWSEHTQIQVRSHKIRVSLELFELSLILWLWTLIWLCSAQIIKKRRALCHHSLLQGIQIWNQNFWFKKFDLTWPLTPLWPY